MFPFHTKTQTAGVFKFLRFEERFQKAPFSKCFTSTPKRKAGVFKFSRFVKRFLKAPFSWRISVHGPPTRKNKAPSWNLTGEVWSPSEPSLASSRNASPLVGEKRCVTTLTTAAKKTTILDKLCWKMPKTWNYNRNIYRISVNTPIPPFIAGKW